MTKKITKPTRPRYIREAVFGMTQNQFAAAIGCTQANVSSMERTDNFGRHSMMEKIDLAARKHKCQTWTPELFFRLPDDWKARLTSIRLMNS